MPIFRASPSKNYEQKLQVEITSKDLAKSRQPAVSPSSSCRAI
jgi:hypothetical protein